MGHFAMISSAIFLSPFYPEMVAKDKAAVLNYPYMRP